MSTSGSAAAVGDPIVLRGTVIGSPAGKIHDGVVVVDGEKISWVGSAADYVASTPVVVIPERTDAVIMPGLIDVHSHGAAGAGFPNTDADGASRAAARGARNPIEGRAAVARIRESA